MKKKTSVKKKKRKVIKVFKSRVEPLDCYGVDVLGKGKLSLNQPCRFLDPYIEEAYYDRKQLDMNEKRGSGLGW